MFRFGRLSVRELEAIARDATGSDVTYEATGATLDGSIVAFSKPVELLARLGGPVTSRIQAATTRRYVTAVTEFVASGAPPS